MLICILLNVPVNFIQTHFILLCYGDRRILSTILFLTEYTWGATYFVYVQRVAIVKGQLLNIVCLKYDRFMSYL